MTADTGLHTGDTVTIEGSGYTPNVSVGFCEAIPNAGNQNDCGKGFEFATTDENGHFSATYQVLRFITPTFGASSEVDCNDAAVDCEIGVAEVNPFPIPETVSYEPIAFADEPVADLVQKRRSDGQLFFDNIYEPIDGLGCCTQVRHHQIQAGGKWTYALRVQNDGETTDDLVLTAPQPNNDAITARYFVGYYNVTAPVNGTGFTFVDVKPGETRSVAVQFAAAPGSSGDGDVVVQLHAGSNNLIEDMLRLQVSIPRT